MAVAYQRDIVEVKLPVSKAKEESSVADVKGKDNRAPTEVTGLIPDGGEDEGHGKLQRSIGLVLGVGLVVGEIIGSGIFITPSAVLCYSGSFGLVLIAWATGGIIALLGGLSYAELGTMITKAGAEYAFILEAFSFKRRSPWLELLGSTLAFLFMWMSILMFRGATAAIIVLAFGRYLSRPFFINCEIPMGVDRLLALSAITVMAIINCVSVRWTARLMAVFTFFKIFAGIFVIILGIVHLSLKGNVPDDTKSPFEYTTHSPGNISLALYSTLFAYSGWNSLSNINEEIKNPNKNLPRAVVIGVVIVTVVYLLMNVALFVSLSYEEITSADTVALVRRRRTLGYKVMGRAGLVVIPILVAITTFGSANVTLLMGARVVFSAARDGLIPDMFSGVHNKFKTPMPAILLQCFIAAVFVMVADIGFLIDAYSSSAWVFYGLTFISLLIMRVTHHKTPRPFKVWLFVPVVMVLASVFLVVLPLSVQVVPSLAGFGIMLLGLPIYILFVMEIPWRLRPKIFDRISAYMTSITDVMLSTTSSQQ